MIKPNINNIYLQIEHYRRCWKESSNLNIVIIPKKTQGINKSRTINQKRGNTYTKINKITNNAYWYLSTSMIWGPNKKTQINSIDAKNRIQSYVASNKHTLTSKIDIISGKKYGQRNSIQIDIRSKLMYTFLYLIK